MHYKNVGIKRIEQKLIKKFMNVKNVKQMKEELKMKNGSEMRNFLIEK